MANLEHLTGANAAKNIQLSKNYTGLSQDMEIKYPQQSHFTALNKY